MSTPRVTGVFKTCMKTASNTVRFVALLALLNFVWEIAQLPLYTIWRDGSWGEIVFAIAHCTAGDVLIGIFSAGGAALLTGLHGKGRAEAPAAFIASFVMIGVSYTVFSEWLNVVVRKSWAYSSFMPTVPPLDTGLSPILQWIFVPVLAWWFTKGRAKA